MDLLDGTRQEIREGLYRLVKPSGLPIEEPVIVYEEGGVFEFKRSVVNGRSKLTKDFARSLFPVGDPQKFLEELSTQSSSAQLAYERAKDLVKTHIN